jgi:multidrug efflux system outer membrane protein
MHWLTSNQEPIDAATEIGLGLVVGQTNADRVIGAARDRRAVVPMALVLLASGCAPGHGYVRPPLLLPDTYRNPSAESAEAATKAALPDWRQVYTDTALRSLIERAVKQSFDVRIAAARVEEARALAGISRRQELPQIAVDAAAARLRVSQIGSTVLLPGTDPNFNVFEVDVTVSYEVDFWGRLRQMSEAARADALAAQEAQRTVTITLIADVATAYYNLLALDASRTLVEKTLDNRLRSLKLTRALFKYGEGSQLDVTRSEANVEAARSLLPDLMRQTETNENQLHALLGEYPGAVGRTSEATTDVEAPSSVPSGLPSALLERRPDIRRAEAALIAAHARWRAARALLLPTIDLTGAAGTQSIPLAGLFSEPARTWSVGFGLLEPLLNAARNGYVIDAAQAREQAAALQYEQTVQQAFREVSDALIAHSRQEEHEEVLRKQIRALDAVLHQAEKRFEVGSANSFEVVDADRDLLAAQLALVQAHRNSLLALVQIYRTLGGGWPAPPSPSESSSGSS